MLLVGFFGRDSLYRRISSVRWRGVWSHPWSEMDHALPSLFFMVVQFVVDDFACYKHTWVPSLLACPKDKNFNCYVLRQFRFSRWFLSMDFLMKLYSHSKMAFPWVSVYIFPFSFGGESLSGIDNLSFICLLLGISIVIWLYFYLWNFLVLVRLYCLIALLFCWFDHWILVSAPVNCY